MVRRGIIAQSIFFCAAAVLVLSVAAIAIFTGYNGLRVFQYMSPIEFFTGTSWSRNQNEFGVLPLLAGSLLTTAMTLVISAPLALAVAIFMVEIAPAPIRRVMRTTVELFASLPSVIYGLLGLTLVVPWVRETFHVGLGKSVLAASLVLVFMTQPTIVSIAEDALRSLPGSLREAALAAGATRWQMIWRVLVPAARPGLLTAIILGTGRAIGETLAVQMVIGNITAKIPDSLFTSATTMPAAIVTQLPEATGDAHRSALIMVAFLLLIIAFLLIFAVRAASSGRPIGGTSMRRATPRIRTERTTTAVQIERRSS